MSGFEGISFGFTQGGSGGSGGGASVVTKTYAQMQALVSGATLVAGQVYFISNKNIWVISLATNELSLSGQYLAFNADYQNIGTYTAPGFIFGSRLGVWNGGLTPMAGDLSIWGGRHWQNNSGAVGSAIDDYNLSSAWTLLPSQDVQFGYINEIDDIEYDFNNDIVTFREDKRRNCYPSLGLTEFQWGNNLVNGNIVNSGSSFTCINNSSNIIDNQSLEESVIGAAINTGTIEGNVVSYGVLDCPNNSGNILGNNITSNGAIECLSNTGDIIQNVIENGSVLSAGTNSGTIGNCTASNSITVDLSTNSVTISGRIFGGDADPIITLTDAATINWNILHGTNAKVTLAASRTLSIANAFNGMYGALKVTQGGTGSYTLTLPGSSKVVNGGAGAVTLSTAVGSIDILSFFYDGTTYFWTLGKNYT